MSPDEPRPDVAALWPAYLDYYRGAIVDAVLALPEEERRRSRVPSGWTPIELLSHVLHMERRWFVWGFLGEQVADAWGDWSSGGPEPGEARWHVPDEVTAEQLAEELRALGRRTTGILAEHRPDELGVPGERFDGPTSLEWICFHVLQEYARHAGQLDIVVELASA